MFKSSYLCIPIRKQKAFFSSQVFLLSQESCQITLEKKTKKNFPKHLVVIKKSLTFAPAFETKRF